MPVTLLFPALAMLLSAVAIRALRRPALAMGLADRPGGRKQHQGIIPLTGGLGVFIGFVVVQPLVAASLLELLPLYAGMALLVACGVYDDARDMRSLLKLGVQLAAALLMVLWGRQVVVTLGDFPGVGLVQLGAIAAPLTVIAVAGLINAVNMMDGIDGLAGGVVVAMLAWLGVVAGLQGQLGLLAVIASLAFAVAGFLVFNLRHPWRRKANVFMGDAGSMALGLAIAWFVVALSQHEQAVLAPVAYGWVLVLPVTDTLSLAIRRVRKGQSPFAADREHLHHLFLRAGFSHEGTTLALVAIVFALGAVGVLGSLVGVPDVLLLLGLIGVAMLHYVFIRHAWRTSKALRRLYANSMTIARFSRGEPLLEVMLRTRPLVAGWRRYLALAGLYLGIFSLALSAWGAALGAGLVLVATLLSCRLFWRDVSHLPLFWVSAGLTLFLVARSLGAELGGSVSPDWRPLVLLAGIISVPLGWWLAQSRLHWPGLFGVLLLGGAAAFIARVDWSRLEQGMLANPWVWGHPAQTGFLASVGLLMLVAMLFSGLQRLGTGWRPAYQVGVAMLLATLVMMVLVATHYGSGWIGALAGLGCFALATPLLGRPQGERLGLWGIAALGALGGISLVTWYGLSDGSPPVLEGITRPLEAGSLYLRGELEAAYAVHAGTVERLMLWGHAREAWLARPLLGSGSMAPTVYSGWLAGYQGFHSLYAGIAVGFGLVGLLGFAAVAVICLRAVLLMAVERIWPAAWVLGLLSSGVSVVVMFALAVPIREAGSLAMMVLLMAACCAAVFQRDWLRQRGVVNRHGLRRRYRRAPRVHGSARYPRGE
ncbi:undecaprenyl/decaprenyl-phosphate alpha-N-acetylglucosaminyl 1-phosphate transferase [Halomonas sp. ATCH28]|uniref:Undecaprenyl/decaprenyl-phosphate alpha-N-acetylglucosaminyl 1-phosphate transferase n=1 Tax=Halomonas gemina TaxID=2945105 RepID=A0ABT0SXP9_9GAMM|nr:MraY family glycosyltransferase [Halomonas gemina]MCL7939435.1 undecaprenyl/decaprenyl-phosphate alpha-N-acetylglucosaminyl 1-phosphate transferase [Halomonas gemina]